MRTVIFGQPKSGTTYLFSLLAEAKSDDALIEVFEPRSFDATTKMFSRRDGKTWPMSDKMLVKVLYADSNMKSGWFADEARAVFKDFDQKIFIVRDPRDRWISGFFYKWFHLHRPDPEDFRRAYELTCQKEQDPSSVPFHTMLSDQADELQQWANRYKASLDELSDQLDALKEEGWHIVKYEDLVDKRWSHLERYLGLTLSKDHGLRASFKHVSRSNRHSNWRNWFTPEDIEFYSPVFNDFLQAQGYNINDWRLNQVDSLPSKEGSEYMHRLFHHPNGPHAIKVPLFDRVIAKLKSLFK